MYKNKPKKWQKLLIYAIVAAFVFMQNMPGIVAYAAGGEKSTSIHVFGVPDEATDVDVNVDGVIKDCSEQGSHWTVNDEGEYVTDEIDSVIVHYGSVSVTYSGTDLDIGMEGGGSGTIRVDVLNASAPTYSINTTVTNGTITADESGIPQGANRTISYSPDEGYHLLSVTVDGNNATTTNPSSVTFNDIVANHTVVVVYEANPTFGIDTTVTNGTITADESGIPQGANRTISYSPAEGYHLLSVTVDGNDATVTNPDSVTFNEIAANHTVVVVYEANPMFGIDTTVTNGTITADESGIPQGANRTISYSPDAGYHLLSVTVDGNDATVTNPDSVTFNEIAANHTVVVVYEANPTFGIDTTVTNGTITADESGIPQGANRTISYSPDTGFHLLSVTVDGEPVSISEHPDSYNFYEINANHTVVVVYEANPTFGIDTTVTNGTITADESGIPQGANRTISYGPNAGCYLVSVTVDGTPVDITAYPDSYTFSEISANHTIEVVYEEEQVDTFEICTSVVGGTITPDITGIPSGENRTISYSPLPGFHLVSVKVDGVPVDITAHPDSFTFTEITADHKIDVVYCINLYTVATSVVNGSITPTFTMIPYGLPLFPVAYAPNPGCYLVSVTVDGVPQDVTTCPFVYFFKNVTANHLVEVVYAPVTFTIDTEVTGGTITPDETNIPYGADRTVTYSPNVGYHLASVTVDGKPVDITAHSSSYAFECIKCNHTISVIYEIDKFSIDTTVTNGTITPDETGIPYGSSRTITYSPNTGYHLVSVTVDGLAVDITTYPTSYAFDSVTANHTVVVVYEINKYTIDTTVTNGTITPDETGILYGSDRTITYSPNEDYTLKSVTVDGVAVDITLNPNSYTFSSIAANHTVVVVYELSDVPDTGDQSNIPLYVAVMALSLAGAAVTFGKARAQKEKSK